MEPPRMSFRFLQQVNFLGSNDLKWAPESFGLSLLLFNYQTPSRGVYEVVYFIFQICQIHYLTSV